MTTRTMTLTSHYNKLTLNIRMNAVLAMELMSKESPMDYIIEELDGIRMNRYLTPSQINKIKGFFSKDSIEYFDSINYAE